MGSFKPAISRKDADLKMQLCRLILTFLLLFALAAAAKAIEESEEDQKEIWKRSWIGDWLKKWKDYLMGKGGHPDADKQCKKRKEDGEVPSAELGDSPVKTFGFPFFDISSRSTALKPGVTLSYMFGKRQPIKIGSRDYVVAGFPGELMAFFECFRDYNIIGSTLAEDGHWYQQGSIKIQLQNLNNVGVSTKDELWEMLFKVGMPRLIKYLNPVKIIKGMDAKIFGTKALTSKMTMLKALEQIKKWLPGNDDFIQKIVALFMQPCPPCDKEDCTLETLKCLKDKGAKLIEFWKQEEARKDKLRAKWVGWDDVIKSQRRIMVTFTMYSKPEHGVRATYNTGKSVLPVAEVIDAMKIFFDNQQPSGK